MSYTCIYIYFFFFWEIFFEKFCLHVLFYRVEICCYIFIDLSCTEFDRLGLQRTKQSTPSHRGASARIQKTSREAYFRESETSVWVQLPDTRDRYRVWCRGDTCIKIWGTAKSEKFWHWKKIVVIIPNVNSVLLPKMCPKDEDGTANTHYGRTWSLYSLPLICSVVIALLLVTNHTVKMFIYSSIDYVLNSNLSISSSLFSQIAFSLQMATYHLICKKPVLSFANCFGSGDLLTEGQVSSKLNMLQSFEIALFVRTKKTHLLRGKISKTMSIEE